MTTAFGRQPDIFIPPADASSPIVITADRALKWRQGQVDLWSFSGNARVVQGSRQVSANEIVAWVDQDELDTHKRLVLYAEGNAVVGDSAAGAAPNRIEDQTWIGRMSTTADVDIRAPIAESPPSLPDVISRAQAAQAGQATFDWRAANPNVANASSMNSWKNAAVAPAPDSTPAPELHRVADPAANSTAAGSMMIDPQTGAIYPSPQQPPPPASQAPAPPVNSGPPPLTRLEIHPRQSSVPLNLKTVASEIPGEQILIANGGVRITIDSRELAQLPEFASEPSSRVYILADSVVAWSNALNPTDPNPENARWEVYLEGNVVFASGRRTVYAERMYYDATYKRGTILRADFYTPAQKYRGLVRLKADVVQQLDDNSFQAIGAAITSSRMGVPRYWLQSDRINLEGNPVTDIDPDTGMAEFDPQTGQLRTRDQYNVESRGNRLYLSSVPVFYWPSFRANLDDPRFYLESINVGNDRIFGTQIETRWDLYQVFGMRPRREGTTWIGALDYLSERGLGFGSDYDYQQTGFLGLPGEVDGHYRSWFIHDSGLDDLGADRRAVPLEEDQRGFAYLNHRQRFRPGFQLRAEFGYISDRNFLEQYFQEEWDWNKDMATAVHLEWLNGNQALDLWGQARINDFFTQTTWAPRLDHFIVGQSWLADRLVYHSHTHIGYARFDQLDPPTNPVDLAKFDFLQWETADAQGLRTGTRHEIDAPFQLGPVKLVPYVLLDGTYWQEDLDGNDQFRAYGQTGLRASMPLWRIDPSIQSLLFNVNGLAHKVTLESEIGYADASADFDRLPLYDPLDDDAQEFFRRRYGFDTFGAPPIPIRFDERDFARRYGIQGDVTSPSAEIADDLLFVRMGSSNRWQTKRGMPGRDNVIDWITLDSGVTFFPQPDRDNYGEVVGLLNYDFRWFIGDRLSLVSDGFADFFSQGLKTLSVGAEIQRPGNGDLYLGVRSIEGPLSSNVLLARMNYRMSDKWGMQAASSYDFGSAGNIGQRVAAIYIGESFLFRLGVHYDVSRDNVGFLFGVEPRFLIRPQMFRPGGVALGPASAEYLE